MAPLTFGGIMPRKQWRFWFAFNRDGTIFLNWRRKKYKVDKLICQTTTETYIRRKYPNLCIRGLSSYIDFKTKNAKLTAIIKE